MKIFEMFSKLLIHLSTGQEVYMSNNLIQVFDSQYFIIICLLEDEQNAEQPWFWESYAGKHFFCTAGNTLARLFSHV